MWRAYAVFLDGFARRESDTSGGGLEDMRSGAELLRQQNVLTYDGLIKVALAEAEASAGDFNRALAIVDDTLATSQRTGHRAFDAELHRARGELLLKRDTANSAMAGDAFRAAVAIAERQGARSFGLRAALSLATLYRSRGHHVEAHAVLAPALAGFAPTPEMPEIADAQALLTALADTDEVKASGASRQRRLKLQSDYAQAVLWSKGYAADETKSAFERTGDLATSNEQFSSFYGRCAWNLFRGEIRQGRGIAEQFLHEAQFNGRAAEVGVAHRVLGFACIYQGDLAEARNQLELALSGIEDASEGEVREKYGLDTGMVARAFLAYASRLSGDLHHARQLIDEAVLLGRELDHLPSLVVALSYKLGLEGLRNDPQRVVVDAEDLLKVCREHGMKSVRCRIADFFELGARSTERPMPGCR